MTLAEITYAEYSRALDVMAHAHLHIKSQFAVTMTRPEAVAHFEARAILINLSIDVLREAETLLLGKAGARITVRMGLANV